MSAPVLEAHREIAPATSSPVGSRRGERAIHVCLASLILAYGVVLCFALGKGLQWLLQTVAGALS